VDGDGKLIKLSAALPSKPEEVERAMAGKKSETVARTFSAEFSR
jgi:hypothetical protein